MHRNYWEKGERCGTDKDGNAQKCPQRHQHPMRRHRQPRKARRQLSLGNRLRTRSLIPAFPYSHRSASRRQPMVVSCKKTAICLLTSDFPTLKAPLLLPTLLLVIPQSQFIIIRDVIPTLRTHSVIHFERLHSAVKANRTSMPHEVLRREFITTIDTADQLLR